MGEHTDVDWQRTGRELAAAFEPDAVDWRPAGNAGANKTAQLVAYIDGAAVMERLDAVVGPGNWSFRWEPLVMDKDVKVAKGILTIHGVTKEDVGTASNWEPSKGCVSDALKRAAVQWGIGRYLRDIPQVRCQLDEHGNIPAAMREKLKAALRRHAGQQTNAEAPQAEPVQAEREAPTPQPAKPAHTPQAVNELAGKPTPGDEQMVLAEKIRAAGLKTIGQVETFAQKHIGREIDGAALGMGRSDITMGETSRLLLELNKLANARQQQAAQQSA